MPFLMPCNRCNSLQVFTFKNFHFCKLHEVTYYITLQNSNPKKSYFQPKINVIWNEMCTDDKCRTDWSMIFLYKNKQTVFLFFSSALVALPHTCCTLCTSFHFSQVLHHSYWEMRTRVSVCFSAAMGSTAPWDDGRCCLFLTQTHAGI